MPDKDIFKSTPYPVSKLLNDIESGDIALPDLQRPFIWKPKQIRDLFDSLYCSFPAGFILLWEIGPESAKTRQIGVEEKTREPRFLVVDGQQRLTSLYSVMKNSAIVNQKFEKFKPTISFNPLTAEFEVYNPAIGKDIFWIPDISNFFMRESTYSYIKDFLKNLKDKKGINDEEEKEITKNLEKLAEIKSYPFTVLELSSNLDTEVVSDIFIRVNSKGNPLKQSDFVMTVLSVYLPALREQIEKFSLLSKTLPETPSPSPYNSILQPDTDHLVRIVIADAFSRGRLKYAHALLKGRELETRTESKETRLKNLKLFERAADRALDLTRWHDSIKILKNIGIVNRSLISSSLTIYFTYALYIYAYQLGFDQEDLEKFVGAWIYFSILTSRYIGSPETAFERDLTLLKKEKTRKYFRKTYKRMINSGLTKDFWEITLPSDILVSSSSRNPAYLAYLMVLNMRGAKALFSETRIRDVFGGEEKYKKTLLDKHHIFPANYLKKKGYTNTDINQVANLCYLEFPINIKISDKGPGDYFPKLLRRCKSSELYLHAIPKNFWKMDYPEFLEERRRLVAKVIKRGVQKFIEE